MGSVLITKKGVALEKASRVSEAVAEYEKAARLYRDDYPIEDLYEDWTAVERQRLTDAYYRLITQVGRQIYERRAAPGERSNLLSNFREGPLQRGYPSLADRLLRLPRPAGLGAVPVQVMRRGAQAGV